MTYSRVSTGICPWILLLLFTAGTGCGDSEGSSNSPLFYAGGDATGEDIFQWGDVYVHNPFVEEWEIPPPFCSGLDEITSEGCSTPALPGPTCPGLKDDSCGDVLPGPICNGVADPSGACLTDLLDSLLCHEECQPTSTPGPASACETEPTPSIPEDVTHVLHVDPGAPLAGADGSLEQPFPTPQLAFDFAQEGTWIVLHPGMYSGPLSITDSITLLGCGPDEVIISASAASPSILTVNAPGVVALKGFSLTGGTIGLHLLGGSQVTAQDLEIHDVSGVGVLVESGALLNMERIRVRDILKDKINPGIYPGAGIMTSGTIDGKEIEVRTCSGPGLKADKCEIQLTDSQIDDNDGGGFMTSFLYEGSFLSRTSFEDNAFRSISMDGGVLEIHDTSVTGTRVSADTTETTAAVHASGGASLTMNKARLEHEGTGFALEMANAFLSLEKVHMSGTACETLISAAGEPFSTPSTLSLKYCLLLTENADGIDFAGPIQASISATRIEGDGGIRAKGPSTFLTLEDIVISLESGRAIDAETNTYLTLSRAAIFSKDAPLLRFADASTLTEEYVITEGTGKAISHYLHESTADIRYHEHRGGEAGWVFVGASSSGKVSHSTIEGTAFASAMALDGATLTIDHCVMDSLEPQWVESGPFSIVGANGSNVDVASSSLGVIRTDESVATIADSALRALHVESPSGPISVVRSSFQGGGRSAIHLQGDGGALQGETLSIKESITGITLDLGANATLKHLDILEPTGAGIALLGGSLTLEDTRIEGAGDHGIHAVAPDGMSSFNNVWINGCAGAGIWAENTELLLNTTWVSHTHHGGLSGEGDGLVASEGAHVTMGSGGLVLNARAGALFQDASGVVAGMTLEENGGEHELNLVLQGESDVEWSGLATQPIKPDEDNALAFPLLSFTPPEIYPLVLPLFENARDALPE